MAACKKILVIVVTYNGLKYIDNCLSPLASAGTNIETMVIDNSSSDGTPGYVKNKYPFAKVIVSERNLGFGAANNIGFKYALKHGFDFVYLLNQDAWIAPEDIERLVSINIAHPEYGIISPLQVYRGMTKMDNNFSHTLPRMLINDWVLNIGNKLDVYATDRMVQAAHWLLCCDVIKKVGGFSPAFFHYGEDHNLCHRVWYWGYKIGVVPSVKGVHDRENRVESMSKELFLLGQRWRYFISNPNVSNKSGLWMVLRSVRKSLLRYKFQLMKPICLFIKDLNKILRIKKMGCSEGAFLDDSVI